MMIMTRISAFFLVLPIFGATAVPNRIKITVILILSVFFSVYMPCEINVYNVSLLQAVLLLSAQLCCGLMLALIIVMIFSVVKIAGGMAEREMGLTMSEILDPLSGEGGQPVALLLEMIFILIFLSANGHHFFLQIMHRSFIVIPPGQFGDIAVMTDAIVKAGSAMLIAGLRLSAPILGAFLLLMIVLAVLARIAPEMNILFISFPLKIGLGFIMLTAFVPFLQGFVTEFSEWMAKLLPL